MSTHRIKRLVYSLAIVLAWLGFVIEGSFALFSDGAVLAGNTLTTGTSDLMISNSQNSTSTIYDESRPGFSYRLNPGESAEKFFILKNVTESGPALDIGVFAQVPSVVPELMNATRFEFVPVDGEGVATGTAVNASLTQLTSGSLNLGASVLAGSTQRFKMKTLLDSGYSQQNVSLSYDLYFTGLQHYEP